MKDTDDETPAFSLARFRERYAARVRAFVATAAEEELSVAHALAREGVGQGLAIGDLLEIHREIVADLAENEPGGPDAVKKAEDFFFDALSIYDMTLRGRLQNIQLLREEISDRKAVEAELRAATAKLARQRDTLDAEVRRRTREIAETADDLKRTNARLIDASREQAEFSYAISHDLKSPNNTIAMLVEILREDYADALPPEAAEILRRASDTTARMGRLIEDIMQYAQTLEKTPDFESFAARALVEEILDDLAGDITRAAAEVTVEEMPELRASRLQMRMLFQNLISNAIKFRDPARRLCVTIAGRTEETTGKAVFEISDTGIGIAPEHQQKVFGLFQRLHLHDDYPGSGLGLALCHRIVSNHGGEVGVTSVPGAGSTFTFTLDPRT